jgi:Retroviral aspartyl protease
MSAKSPEYNCSITDGRIILSEPTIILPPPSKELSNTGPSPIIRFVHTVSVSTNHKIPCLLGFTSCTHRPYTAILDTGAGPNLIRQDQLPPDWETHQPARKPPEATVRDANGRELNVMGHLRLSCRVGNHTTGATFLVLEHLAVPLILGCDYIDKNVHSLQPGVGKVTLQDGSHVSLIRSKPLSGPAIVRCAKQITLPS